MTTIKAYASVEQSRRLAKFLPIESADMYYREWKRDTKDIRIANVGIAGELDLPCWSLAALMDILPNNEHITTSVSRGSWQIEPVNYLPNTWWCEYENDETMDEFNVSSDNPVDACYEMILRLHKLEIL